MLSADRQAIDIAGCALAVEVIGAFGAVRLRVNGTSMLPAIRNGDVLEIRRCGLADVAIGDVALIARDGRLFAHRVVDHRGSVVVTRGDANPDADPAAGAAELLGKVTGHSRPRRAQGIRFATGLAARVATLFVRRLRSARSALPAMARSSTASPRTAA